MPRNEIAPNFWRTAARYGFMERPDIPALLQQAYERGCTIALSDVTYYVGHETVLPAEDQKALPRWVEGLFALMQRNSAHVSDYLSFRSTRSSRSAVKSPFDRCSATDGTGCRHAEMVSAAIASTTRRDKPPLMSATPAPNRPRSAACRR
jgi:hypothetical protein